MALAAPCQACFPGCQPLPTRYVVQVKEYLSTSTFLWIDCVREDLLESFDGDSRDLPRALFPLRADAERFITDLCLLMHMGGDPDDFRIVPVRA